MPFGARKLNHSNLLVYTKVEPAQEHDDKYNYVFVLYSPKVTVVKTKVNNMGLVC